EAAKLLWNAEQNIDFSSTPARKSRHNNTVPNGSPGRVAAFTMLATLAATAHSTRGRLPRVLHDECQNLIDQLAAAFGAQQGRAPLHQRFAQAWGLSDKAADHLRTAMVLLAEHELTSSAFATRIAASNAASLPSCLLAGLTTLAAPLHGDASGRAQALFQSAQRLGEDEVIAHHLSSGLPLAGFGYHIYPGGDPRAATL